MNKEELKKLFQALSQKYTKMANDVEKPLQCSFFDGMSAGLMVAFSLIDKEL